MASVRTLVMVYPRVCGGAIVTTRAELHAEGLSPRVRGSQLEIGFVQIRLGSIPACAGEPRTL